MTDPYRARETTEVSSFVTPAAIGQLWLRHQSAFLAIAIRGTSVLAGAVVAWIVGRFLGSDALGTYAIATQTGQLLCVIGLFGLDLAVVRQFSRARAEGRRVAMDSLIKTAAIAGLALVVIAALLIFSRQAVAERIFANAVPQDIFFLVALVIIGRGGARFFGAFLRSQGAFNLGQAIEALFIPLLTSLFCVYLLAGNSMDVDELLLANGLIGIVALLFGAVLSFARADREQTALRADYKGLWASALPLWGVAIIASVSDWYALTIAASRIDLAAAGTFRVAAQVTMAMQVISIAIFNLYTPKIAAAFHKDSLVEVGKLARAATILSAGLAFPISLTILIFAEPIMGFFGPEFASSATILRILVIGQLAFTMTGPSGLTMAMAGHERTNFNYNAIAIVLLLVAAPLAASIWGLEGLAITVSISILFKNLAALAWLRFRLGLNALTGTVHSLSETK